MTRLTLRDDARNNQVDHALEPWTIPIPPIAVEDGHIAGHLIELNGHFNLTNLLPATGVEIRNDDAALQRASRAIGISSTDLVKVLGRFQEIRKTEPHGTPDLDELVQRVSLSAASQDLLSKHAVVLPEKTPINVNFADAESLQASIDGLTSGDASTLIARRSGTPFMKLEDFRSALPQPLRDKAGDDVVAVQSRYFLVQIDAWFNNVHLGYESMLRRDGTDTTVLWTRRASLADS